TRFSRDWSSVLCSSDLTAPPLTVTPDAPPARAARIMARRGVKRLPVVDGEGVLKGIVSRADLLKVFLRGDDEIAREIRGVIASGRFPASMEAVRVDVRDGAGARTGHAPDPSLVPFAVRVVRPVEGVVDVPSRLSGPRRRPPLDPDFADDAKRPDERDGTGGTPEKAEAS